MDRWGVKGSCGSRALCLFAVVVAASLLFSSSPAFAQSTEDLKRIERQVSEQKAAKENLEKKEQATAGEIEDLRGKLVEATSALQKKQAEQNDLEDRLSDLEKQLASKAIILEESRARLAVLTSALLELSREQPGLFVLREQSEAEHAHRAILLRSLIPQLKEETTNLAKEVEKFETLQKQAASQKRLVTAAQQNLEWQRHNLDQMVRTRQGLLQRTSAQKEALAQQLESLTKEAKDLRQLMEKVSSPSWGKEVGKGVASGKPATLKQGLRMPVSGKMIRDYGSKDDFGVVSEGVMFAGSPGAPVVAPQSGKVVFAGPFRGYGRIVILQHPGGYHTFLAGFGRIDADMGQTVGAGEPLGALPEKDAGKPEIYFEWRKGATPVDPTTSLGK